MPNCFGTHRIAQKKAFVNSILTENGKSSLKMKENKRMIDPSSQDFGTICVCAVRYSLGRQTYIPKLVIDYIRPLLPHLDKFSLVCMLTDVVDAKARGCLGDENIDKPEWERFCTELCAEVGRMNND